MAIIEDSTVEVLLEVGNRVDVILEEMAADALAEAKRLVPVRTGDLKRSIVVEIRGRRIILGSDLHYAPYVEMGTPKAAARPFLRPAIELITQKLRRRFRRYFR